MDTMRVGQDTKATFSALLGGALDNVSPVKEIQRNASPRKVEFCSVCGNVGHNASNSCCPY